MNAASATVLALVVALAALAAWRAMRHGAPCECGGTCREKGACPCKAAAGGCDGNCAACR